MFARHLAIGFSLVLIPITLGCRREPLAEIKGSEPEQLTLYSLSPREFTPEEAAKLGENFHGWEVLGKLEIHTPEKRKELLDSLKDAVARRQHAAACFWPRHGLRVVVNGKTIDYVVCFQCSQLWEFVDGKNHRSSLNPDVQPTFDKPLLDAGIPVAPKDHPPKE